MRGKSEVVGQVSQVGESQMDAGSQRELMLALRALISNNERSQFDARDLIDVRDPVIAAALKSYPPADVIAVIRQLQSGELPIQIALETSESTISGIRDSRFVIKRDDTTEVLGHEQPTTDSTNS